MFSEKANKTIATIIVGAMSIDGTLNKQEREHVAHILNTLGQESLIPLVGIALEEDFGDFDLFRETRELKEAIGANKPKENEEVFKIVSSVVASDRFLSSAEASFLSALSRRLKIPTHKSQAILKEIIEHNRGKIEISGDQVDAMLHPHLKELLSFTGSEEKVGIINENSLEERLIASDKVSDYTPEDIQEALKTLGLEHNGTIEDAEEAWRYHLKTMNLSKLADQGVSFVSAGIKKAEKINAAYELLQGIHNSLGTIVHKEEETDAIAV